MDKFERRRLDLIALVNSIGHGGIARVAAGIGKDASYVSRMLYEPGKAGRKRIGEDSVDALDHAFPGWRTLTDPSSTSNEIAELSEVVTRLTTSGQMQITEVQAMIAMLKAREGKE